jgi:tRNA dimethylallyltransferase
MHLAGEQPLAVILGPTATGKTRLGIAIAQALNGEIVGADSRQIYRHMDIGTAKPSPTEQKAATHHLIDVVNPNETLSLAQYQRMAYETIHVIHQRGQLPILVGGTGQYISAVIEGWSIPEVPPNDALRAELEAYAQQHGANALHQRLKQHDPEAAASIHPNNIRRVVRALEVCIETNTPITELQRKKPPPYRILQIGLQMEREALYERADNRVNQMMAASLLDEVADLLSRGYHAKLPAMSGIGYRQLAAYLADEVSLEQAIYDIKMQTHDFIRRQYTWFRGHDDGILWHNSQHIESRAIIEDIRLWLKESHEQST